MAGVVAAIEVLGAWGNLKIAMLRRVFGAQVFSSELSVVNGQTLHGSDGHSSAPQVSAGLNSETTDQWGYLDQMTTPLLNTGLTSLGLGHTELVVVK